MILISEYKNVRKETNDPLEIERLKEMGYTELELKSPTAKKPKKEDKNV